MTTATTTKNIYRKTKSGEWVVCGPTGLIHAGSTVTVAKRDGTTKTERIERTGRPFWANGTEMVYGYIAKTSRHSSSSESSWCDHPERRGSWCPNFDCDGDI